MHRFSYVDVLNGLYIGKRRGKAFEMDKGFHKCIVANKMGGKPKSVLLRLKKGILWTIMVYSMIAPRVQSNLNWIIWIRDNSYVSTLLQKI